MLKRPARMTASVAALLTATTAFAEPTIEELDMRMRAMENTMQSILELLQEQQATGTSPAAASSNDTAEAPAAVPAGYQMGGLYLDVFTRVFADNNEYVGMLYDPKKLPNGPVGVPAGSALIKAPNSFDYGAFGEESALSGFRQADALVGVQWSGVLQIEEDGEHTFLVQIKKNGRSSATTCRSVLRVSDKVVADALADYSGGGEQVDMAQSTQTLAKGIYDFSLWTNCQLQKDARGFDSIVTTVGLAAPGDRAPKPIPPERFGVQP